MAVRVRSAAAPLCRLPSVGGLSARDAAAIVGMSADTFRRSMSRARGAGLVLTVPVEEWPFPDRPMYDEAAVKAWAGSRPGKGNRSDKRGHRPRSGATPQ